MSAVPEALTAHDIPLPLPLMETSEILAKLKSLQIEQENQQSQDAKEAALSMLSCTSDVRQLLHDLLTKVVKPLFLKQQHPNLTATGRKKLVPDTRVAGGFSDSIDWDDELSIWKNGWTIDLLLFCVSQYPNLPASQEQSTFESQFHLLIPPILNLIDDGDIQYKAQGCKLLRLLCEEVVQCQSDILKRTGLSDVFSDALKTNFMHLPTLTPEEKSLKLLSELYPAFRALIDARFPSHKLQQHRDEEDETVLSARPPAKAPPTTKSARNTSISTLISPKPPSPPDTEDKDARQSLLDLILRQGLLTSYAHATDYVGITTLLLHEASLVVSMMGIYAAKYLQTLLPLLRSVLSSPFGTAYVPLLLSALECLEILIRACWPRIRERWWADCLRGFVGCWMQIADDQRDQKEKVQDVEEVKRKLRQACELLANVVGEDFDAAKQRLEQEDERLEGLFVTTTDAKQGVS